MLTKSWMRCISGAAVPLAAAVIIFGAGPGQVEAAQAPTPEKGSAGEEIVLSLQQKGTNPANFKIAEVDADIVLDAVALTVGPEGK